MILELDHLTSNSLHLSIRRKPTYHLNQKQPTFYENAIYPTFILVSLPKHYKQPVKALLATTPSVLLFFAVMIVLVTKIYAGLASANTTAVILSIGSALGQGPL